MCVFLPEKGETRLSHMQSMNLVGFDARMDTRGPSMRLGLALLAFLLAGSKAALGWACGPQPACAVVRPESVVFVGRFLDPGAEWSVGRPERPARLEVVEQFAGLDAGEDEVRIEGILPWINPTGLWLISAVRKKDSRTIQIDICGNTGPLTERQEELDYLQRRSRGETISRISGSVEVFGEPLGGVEVVAVTPSGIEYRTTTDALGDYELTHVAPGEHSMHLELSDSQTELYRPVPPNPWEDIELPGDRAELGVAQGSCAYASFALAHDGEISGRLFEVNGDPAGGVPVQLRSVADRAGLWRDKSLETDSSGTFRFVGVNPGRYRLGVNINKYDRRAPYRTTYYPDVASEDEAQVVQLGEAEKVEGLELKLPPRHAERRIEITVVDTEGRPIEGASIANAPTGDHADAYHSLGSSQQTDSNGQITLKAAAGLRYAIAALKRAGEGELLASSGLVIPPGKQGLRLRLVLNHDSAKIDCGDDVLINDGISAGTLDCGKLPVERDPKP